MYAHQPRYAWRGLAKPCGGAGGRAKKGSRAQARTDFAKGVLPGSKAPLSAMVMPSAATMQLWAAALGADAAPAPPQEAPARQPPAAVGSEVDEAPPPPAAEAAAQEEARPQDGLILPGLDGVLSAYGFANVEEARERGRRAASERAEKASARARAVYPTPARHREARG